MAATENIYERAPKRQRRVVVTGMGMVTPLGLNLTDSWQAALAGKSGVARITQFDCTQYDTQIAGEVKDFDPSPYIDKKEQKKMDRFIHLSMAASDMALADSGISWTDELKSRTGVIIGVGMGGLPSIERNTQIILERGPSRVSPFFIPMVITNLASGQISIKHGLQGVNYSVTSACASGAHSIGEAASYIRNGICDVMLAGGAESTVSPLAIAGFGAMRALSTRNDTPERASSPFDRDRDGFVLAEGAATLVLESYEHAARRGARIYGEVAGYGTSSDAFHMTSPPPGGAGAAQAMAMALADAGIPGDGIDYINAHGTSTPVGDELEVQAVKKVLGAHAQKVWVSSTKSMTGHTLGAAGAIESAFALLTLFHNVAPPTINLQNPSEGCDLDFVPWTAREKLMRAVLNNSFGFGGTNASVVFTRV